MLLAMAEGDHAVVQAFVQKLAVCLLDVDRDPSSLMEEEMNNWTAEATCFVSIFTMVARLKVSVSIFLVHHSSSLPTVLHVATKAVLLLKAAHLSGDSPSQSVGHCTAQQLLLTSCWKLFCTLCQQCFASNCSNASVG